MKNVNLQVGDRVYEVNLTTVGKTIEARFRYNPAMIDVIKSDFEGRKWNPDGKFWYFDDSSHNQFRLRYMMGLNPYARYDLPIPKVMSKRPLYDHQLEMKSFILTRHQCILAADPGVGKSLAAIDAAEESGFGDWWWVAPKAALFSVQLESMKWASQVKFNFMTYEKMISLVDSWVKGNKPPRGIIFDESSRLKNYKTQRTTRAKHLADNMRDTYGDDAYVVLMSGTPAPQSPMDWFAQVAVARPGYLKEGSWWAFRDRISIWKDEELTSGGSYPKLVTWLDDEKKCRTCGQDDRAVIHTHPEMPDYHPFRASGNEVAGLYNRMQGLVIVKRKADCLDLPEKIFRRIQTEIPKDMLRIAKSIPKILGTGSKALTALREYSDGFQYDKFQVGESTCDLCEGQGTINDMIYTGPEPTDDFVKSLGLVPGFDIIDSIRFPEWWQVSQVKCNKCRGTCKIPKMATEAVYVGSPKDDILKDLIEEYEEIGRLVIYGAFQASIDKLVEMVAAKGWDYIKADGRSWASSMPGNPLGWLAEFQNKARATKKIVFIGQPEAAGMGLTLTEACAAIFYSNSFNGESRLQAIERIHRPGASKELGVTIIDIVCLPTDLYVLDRLEAKEDLQSITLGSLETCLDTPVERTA